jgi:hypothetical protein
VASVVTQRVIDRRPNARRFALTARRSLDSNSGLHGPAPPDIDFRSRASSNFLPNIVSESGSTDFVESLIRLQAEAAADDLLLDLGGAAEDRLDAADPPELTIVAENSGLILAPTTDCIWSAPSAVFTWCDLGGDYTPWDRLHVAVPRSTAWLRRG